MKLTKRALVLLTCTSLAGGSLVACKGDDKKEDEIVEGDGDGDTGGDGDGDGDGDGSPTGPQCDEPGGAQCTGSASGLVCADGSTNAVSFTCATGEVCQDGECIGQCEPNSTECVGSKIMRICTPDGREWLPLTCAQGEECLDGACALEGGVACIPGSKDCDGDTARTCKADGSGWDENDCPAETACEEGACVGTVCTVGATKCDSSTLNVSLLTTDFQTFPGNFSVIHRCNETGSGWVAEPCPSDEDVQTACAYPTFSASEAAKYRAEMNKWVKDVQVQIYFGGDGDGPSGLPQPSAPHIPEGMNAACTELPEDMRCYGYFYDYMFGQVGPFFEMFFETPAETRKCKDPANPEEGGNAMRGYGECQGILPYAPLKETTVACSGTSFCPNWGVPFDKVGCVVSECFPGESLCDETEGEYSICFMESSSSSCGPFSCSAEFYSYFESGYSCESEPGLCTDNTDSAPDRKASCDGVEVGGQTDGQVDVEVESIPL